MDPKLRFLEMLNTVAALANVSLTKTLVGVYVEELEPVGLERATAALRRYATKTTPRTGLPTVEQIKADLGAAEPSDESKARDAVSRIIQAISVHGYNWPERAQAAVGTLGWELVRRAGGWEAICQEYTYAKEHAVLAAQWRELAKSLLERARTGQLDTAPSLYPAETAGVVSKALTLALNGGKGREP